MEAPSPAGDAVVEWRVPPLVVVLPLSCLDEEEELSLWSLPPLEPEDDDVEGFLRLLLPAGRRADDMVVGGCPTRQDDRKGNWMLRNRR